MRYLLVILAVVVNAAPALAAASGGEGPHLDGALLGLVWAVPFVGILLSIALFPLFAPHFWEHHFGKVSAFWGLTFIVPFALLFGIDLTAYSLVHTALLEYIPFIILLFALFTVTGGIGVTGRFNGTPGSNTAILAFGTIIASWTGTTGASMLLIRPILEANRWRKNVAHVAVFFIFLVSNIGGSLTPLGDPPLFLGFLKGVEFFWTTRHIVPETLFMSLPLLAIFYVVDRVFIGREQGTPPVLPANTPLLAISGWINVALLGAVVGAVLLSGVWKPGVTFSIYHTEIELQNIVRDVLLVVIAIASLKLTASEVHQGNEFAWGPIKEVAKLFAAIFVTILPVIAMLRAGSDGALRSIVALVSSADGTVDNAMYFWLTGILSSFLDNAPTYLVFFNLAGGDAQVLMYQLPATLAAISAGAVFMGANSYIGNAPNFMVKAIAESRGVRMPSFFGYMAWSCGILVPLFVLLTFVFFR